MSITAVRSVRCGRALGAVVGVSALLVTSAVAFSVVKYAGAIYLTVLGVRTIARRRAGRGAGVLPPRSMRRLYVDGIVVNVLNPKTALFFFAFLPQFVRPNGSAGWVQTLVLGALFVGIGLMTDSAYAMAGARLGRWLRGRPSLRRRGPVVEGGILVGLGVVTLATPHRHRA